MMDRPGCLSLSERIYRALLLVYPAPFRREYGVQMAQVFCDCCRDAYRRSGRVGIAVLWTYTLCDLAASALDAHLSEEKRMLKRMIDIVFALFWLWMLAPLLALIAIAIKLDSRGPVFYRDSRIGRGGQPFVMYKFRTMFVDGEQRRGARVTRVGRLLRATLLDELPTFFNVLRGEMSLVGPRPPVPGVANLDDPAWRRVLTLRPGISGLEQVTNNFASVDAGQRLELNLRYLESRSALLDLKLLWRTLWLLIGPRQPGHV
jgi:lipopolysaccharide/colanic/teichoic acid biosynthesis glycosyltransferase